MTAKNGFLVGCVQSYKVLCAESQPRGSSFYTKQTFYIEKGK